MYSPRTHPASPKYEVGYLRVLRILDEPLGVVDFRVGKHVLVVEHAPCISYVEGAVQVLADDNTHMHLQKQ